MQSVSLYLQKTTKKTVLVIMSLILMVSQLVTLSLISTQKTKAETIYPELISKSVGGVQGNAISYNATYMSDNGRYVLFFSEANNLTEDLNDGPYRSLIKDRLEGDIDTIYGLGPYKYGGSSPVLSGDGRKVIFYGNANDYFPGSTSLEVPILKNLDTGVHTRLDIDNNESPVASSVRAISDDGSRILITNQGQSSYIRNSLDNTFSELPVERAFDISGDGNTVLYYEVSAGFQVVYAYNVLTNSSSRVAEIVNNAQETSISDDGRYVLIWTEEELVPGTNQLCDPISSMCTKLYRKDLTTGNSILVDINVDHFYAPLTVRFSGSGNVFSWQNAENKEQIFTKHIDTGVVKIVSINAGTELLKSDSNGGNVFPGALTFTGDEIVINADANNFGSEPYCIESGSGGARSAFSSFLKDGDPKQCGDVYVLSGDPAEQPIIMTAPSNLSAQTPTKKPVLNWDSVSNATSYNIYRDGDLIGSSTNLQYEDLSVGEGTYEYYVTALNNTEESDESNKVLVEVDKTRPTMSFLEPSSFTDTFLVGPNVVVSAYDNSGLKSLVIHVYSSNNQLLGICGSASPQQIASGEMSCSLTSLPTGTYYIKAGSFDKAGNNKTILSGNFTIL